MEISNTTPQAENQKLQALHISQQSNKISRREFMKLPIEERRRILAQQAEERLLHYQQDKEWQELQTGDLIDY